ncbi:MAG: DSD1 family PLP-dependent enzyme [Acidobacteria bacterium]|nr:MAG: DSD1 family PLP-dependent enzyme [Acidobacteriota bacterium]
MMKRRTFLAAAAAPAVFRSSPDRGSRTWNEVEKILARGDVRGKVTRDELPTPALVLDLDAFQTNIDKMVRYAREHNRALRPHGKTHKCPQIAAALIKAGAIGACAAKLSEAEVFARSGITGILITTAVIGKYKIERLIKLAARHPDTIICLDNPKNASDLNDAARAARIRLNVAIDLMLGRTGIPVREPAAGLAEIIASLSNLKLAGLQAYSGTSSHVIGFEARRSHSQEAMAKAVQTRQMIEKEGIPCPLLTGGSTGTYNIDSEMDGITEIQPGSFIFMDLDYNRIGGQNGDVYTDFQNSLTVRATVVSKPENNVAIVDAGLKAFSTDKPFVPQALGIRGVTYSWAGDEHGRLNLADASRDLNPGDRLEFIVPHCDPSVNLYDRLYCVRGESVEAVWAITARGMSQ